MARKRKISLRNKNIDEEFVQDYFEQNINFLGFTDGVLLDKEEIKKGTKRINLLFQEAGTKNCYTVGIKLGNLDEDHIKNTIEYWNLSKKKYPDLKHNIIFYVGNITSEAMLLLNSYDKQSQIIVYTIKVYKYNEKPSPCPKYADNEKNICFSCEMESNNIKPMKRKTALI